MSGLHYVGLLLSSFITESTLSSKSPILCEEFHWLIEDSLYMWGRAWLVFFKGVISNVQNSLLTGDQYWTAGTLNGSAFKPYTKPFLKETWLQSRRVGLWILQLFSYLAVITTTSHLPGYHILPMLYLVKCHYAVVCHEEMPGSEWDMPKTKSSDQIGVTLIRWHVHRCEELSAPSPLYTDLQITSFANTRCPNKLLTLPQ